MIEGLLTRFEETTDHILGKMTFPNFEPLYTIELPWHNNEHMISCIPAGSYEVDPFNWDNLLGLEHRDVYQIMSVPKRNAILIHNGNWASDSKGCIVIGMKHGQLKQKSAVLDSNLALSMLRSFVGQQKWRLTIKGEINGKIND